MAYGRCYGQQLVILVSWLEWEEVHQQLHQVARGVWIGSGQPHKVKVQGGGKVRELRGWGWMKEQMFDNRFHQLNTGPINIEG
jgi:hypothetical protein